MGGPPILVRRIKWRCALRRCPPHAPRQVVPERKPPAPQLPSCALTSRSSRHTKLLLVLTRRSSCSGSNVLHCFGRSSCAAPSAATLMHRFGQSPCGGSKMRATASPPKCCWILMRRSSSQILSATLLWPALMRCSKCCSKNLSHQCQRIKVRSTAPAGPHAASSSCSKNSSRSCAALLWPILMRRIKCAPLPAPSAAGSSHAILMRRINALLCVLRGPHQVPRRNHASRPSCSGPMRSSASADTKCGGAKRADRMPGAMASNRSSRLFRHALLQVLLHPHAAPSASRSSCGGSNALHCFGRSKWCTNAPLRSGRQPQQTSRAPPPRCTAPAGPPRRRTKRAVLTRRIQCAPLPEHHALLLCPSQHCHGSVCRPLHPPRWPALSLLSLDRFANRGKRGSIKRVAQTLWSCCRSCRC